MQTVTLEVQDKFVPNLLEYLKQFKNEVKIKEDKNLQHDPYFYERQKQLQEDLKDIENGNIEMLSQEQYDNQMDNFLDHLKSKHAN